MCCLTFRWENWGIAVWKKSPNSLTPGWWNWVKVRLTWLWNPTLLPLYYRQYVNIVLKNLFLLLILEGEKDGNIDLFLQAPWLGIRLAISALQDDALTELSGQGLNLVLKNILTSITLWFFFPHAKNFSSCDFFLINMLFCSLGHFFWRNSLICQDYPMCNSIAVRPDIILQILSPQCQWDCYFPRTVYFY